MPFVTNKTKTKTIAAGSRDVISLAEGQVLTVTGSVGVSATVNLVDPILGGANYIKTYQVTVGANVPIGPMKDQQKFVIICTAGSVDSTLSDATLSLPQLSSDGSKLVNPSGQNLLIVGKYKCLLPIGTSITELNRNCGRSFSGNVNITGLIFQGASLNWPDGAATLRFDKAAGTLSIQAFGDTIGPAVYVANGFCGTLTSGNPAYTFRVGVKYAYLPATSQNDTLTPTTSQWARLNGGWLYVFQAMTYNRFRILPLLGISGDQVQYMGQAGGRYDQAIAIASARGDTVIVDEGGTNDIHLTPNRTAAEIAGFRIAFWKKCAQAGIPVLAQLISPRWGRDASGTPGTDNAFYSVAYQGTLVTANSLMRTAAKDLPNVFLIDNYSKTTDATQAQGRAKDGWTDAAGIHPYAPMAVYGFAPDMVRAMNILSPGDNVAPNVGAGSYYDAVNNPSGNLLAANTGAFAGTGGSAGSGVTVGTGLAASMTCAHAGAAGSLVATANKVVADDHGADWQELVLSGCTSQLESIGMYFPTISNTKFTAGVDTIAGGVEFRIIGTGCYGVYLKINVGGAAYAILANQLQNITSGLDNTSMYLSFEDYPIPAGATSFDTQIYVSSLIGASFKIQYRNADIHKVL